MQIREAVEDWWAGNRPVGLSRGALYVSITCVTVGAVGALVSSLDSGIFPLLVVAGVVGGALSSALLPSLSVDGIEGDSPVPDDLLLLLAQSNRIPEHSKLEMAVLMARNGQLTFAQLFEFDDDLTRVKRRTEAASGAGYKALLARWPVARRGGWRNGQK